MHIQKILVPTDFSVTSQIALDSAATLARVHGARVTLLHVYQAPGHYFPEGYLAAGEEATQRLRERLAAALDELTRRVIAAGAPAVDALMAEGVPFSEIVRVAGDFDLVVMATHGRTGLKHALLGSVAERVVRVCPCPVMTVRPPDHDFR